MRSIHLLIFIIISGISERIHAENNPPIIFIQEWLQKSKISELTEDKWIMVEFWATWCGPCHQIYSHIEQIQDINKDQLYVISLSKERADVIEKFLKNKNMKTAIAVDSEGKTHRQFGVTSLPFAVLLAPDGTLKWSGHPSELSLERVKKMIKQRIKTTPKPIAHKINLSTPKVNVKDIPVYNEKKGYKWRYINDDLEFTLFKQDSTFQFTGPVWKLVSYGLSTPNTLISSEKRSKKNIELLVNLTYWDTNKMSIISELLKDMNITVKPGKKDLDVMKLKVVNPEKFWTVDQINWGNGSPPYLLDGENLKVNDASVYEFARILSNSLDTLVEVVGGNGEIHDWDVHIRYFPLMAEQLKEEYGILVFPAEKESMDIVRLSDK